MAVDLTPGAISMLLSGEHAVREPVVQVIDIKCTQTRTEVSSNGVAQKNASYKVVLSDGWVCEAVIVSYKINEMIGSNQLQKGSVVQLTKFSCITENWGSFITVHDLSVIRCNCVILGDPKPFTGNKTPSVKNFITPKSEEDHVDPDVNDDRHHADEHTASKRQRQSSDNKEDDEIGACFEKLEKLGWGEGPMYDTTVLLFGESSDYRKIWLHLKPKSCVNWVKNAGSKYGLLG